MTVVITGGGGYIGASIAQALVRANEPVTVVDKHFHHTVDGATKIQADLSKIKSIAGILRQVPGKHIDVIHLAAHKQVGESVKDPTTCYRNNLMATIAVVQGMQEEPRAWNVIHSSSAAVYGKPAVSDWIHEDDMKSPINPYGQSKLMSEQIFADGRNTRKLNDVHLRYFNVAGAVNPNLGDPNELNLIPIVLGQLIRGEQPEVFGYDYQTVDGSCVRDYIHISDLVEAHIRTLRKLRDGQLKHRHYNVGTGQGTSVLNVLDAIGQVTGEQFTPKLQDRRAGDPPYLVANPSRLERDLGWVPEKTVDQMIRSAWEANYVRQ